jgi:hypothetical protein
MTMFRDFMALLPFEYPATAAEELEIERYGRIVREWAEALFDRAEWEAAHPTPDARPLVPVEDTGGSDDGPVDGRED